MTHRALLVLIHLILLSALSAWGQSAPVWERVGLEGVVVFSVLISPEDNQTIYVGSNAGLLRSVNGGRQFSRVLGGLPSNQVVMQMLARPDDSQMLYAATGSAGLFQSRDGGASWDRVPDIPQIALGAIVFDPTDADRVFVATFGQGIFRSLDGGQTFAAANQGLPAQPGARTVRPILIDPNNPNILYAGTNGAGVFRSEDGGDSWESVSGRIGNQPVPLLFFDPQNPSRLIAGTDSDGVFISENGAQSWERLLGAIDAYFVVSAVWSASNPEWIFLGSRGNARGLGAGVLWSRDGGQTFEELDDGLTSTSVHSLAQNPQTPTVLYAGTEDGLFIIELL